MTFISVIKCRLHSILATEYPYIVRVIKSEKYVSLNFIFKNLYLCTSEPIVQ